MPSSTDWWSDGRSRGGGDRRGSSAGWDLPSVPEGWLPEALNGGWIYRDRVDAGGAGLTVSRFYAERHRHSDGTIWRQRLAAGEIHRNDVPLKGDGPLAAGDRLAWHRPPWREGPVPARWTVVFDDGDLLVLDKPSGLPVLPAGGWLEHTLLRLLERRHRSDPGGVPRPVHRLGRFTSGLLVCARRPASRAWLSAILRESTAAGVSDDPAEDLPPGSDGEAGWAAPAEPLPGAPNSAGARRDGRSARGAGSRRQGGCRKLYRALLVPGALDLEPGESRTIGIPIGRRPHPLLGSIWCAADGSRPDALPALSRLTLLQRGAAADLVAVAIASGRPHQIRIHCAAAGAPLLGDPLYGAGGGAAGGAAEDALPGDGGYRLQAWRLALRRPDGSRLELEAPRPLTLEVLTTAAGWPAPETPPPR